MARVGRGAGGRFVSLKPGKRGRRGRPFKLGKPGAKAPLVTLGINRFVGSLVFTKVRTDARMELLIIKIGLEIFLRVVKKTPVDTGRLRASWNISTDFPDTRVEPSRGEGSRTPKGPPPPPAGGPELSKAKSFSYDRFGDKFPKIWITNNLPYAQIIEDGTHSKQGGHMVSSTLVELNRQKNVLIKGIKGDTGDK